LALGTTSFSVTTQVSSALGAGTTLNASADLAVDSGGSRYLASDGESTQVRAPANLTATKSVTGNIWPGSTVTYAVVLHNAGPGPLQDLAGDEMVDVLPATLQLLSASAASGTALAVTANNTVTWNGTIPAGGSVTVTITARIIGDVGTTVSNQASVSWDGVGDGASNGSRSASTDPANGGAGGPTNFVIVATPPTHVPAMRGVGLALLILTLAIAAGSALRARAACRA
jgi:uncharacterized repeat protein (TIGR01451 family)